MLAYCIVKIMFLILISSLCLKETATKNRARMVIINRFDVCYMPENPPLKLHYFQLNTLQDHNYSLSTSAEVLETMEAKDLYADVDVVRCANKDSLDTCENFVRLTPPVHVCKLILINELGIAKAINSFKPPIRCPIKQGNYSAEDLGYQLKDFTLFPIGNYYWRIRANGYYKKRKVATVCIDAQTIDRN